MPKGSISLVVMIIGLLLLMVSFFYNPDKHTESAWSEEQAVEHAAAASKLHDLSYAHAGDESNGGAEPAELAEARRKFEAGQAQLEAARSGRKWNARILLIAGFLFTTGGVIANRLGY